MARGQAFQVRNGRFQFICSQCKAKRHMPVPPTTRRRSVRCHKCGTQQRCLLNRRDQARERQRGKIVMVLRSGKEIAADLHDISSKGLGCDVHPRDARTISLRQEVKFKCSWSPQLLEGKRYVVKNILGNRIGCINMTPGKFG